MFFEKPLPDPKPPSYSPLWPSRLTRITCSVCSGKFFVNGTSPDFRPYYCCYCGGEGKSHPLEDPIDSPSMQAVHHLPDPAELTPRQIHLLRLYNEYMNRHGL